MEMEFDTDGQRRQAICDCVKMLAEIKSLPIYVSARDILMDDGAQVYLVCVTDKAVMKHLMNERGKVKFVGQPFDSYEAEVRIPLSFFDANRVHATDGRFYYKEKVAKVYARIGQRIYVEWKLWRKAKWPDVK